MGVYAEGPITDPKDLGPALAPRHRCGQEGRAGAGGRRHAGALRTGMDTGTVRRQSGRLRDSASQLPWALSSSRQRCSPPWVGARGNEGGGDRRTGGWRTASGLREGRLRHLPRPRGPRHCDRSEPCRERAPARLHRDMCAAGGHMPPYSTQAVSDRSLADIYAFIHQRPRASAGGTAGRAAPKGASRPAQNCSEGGMLPVPRERSAGRTQGPRIGPNPMPFARFSSYIRRPTGEMPPYTDKVMSDQDMADVYAYVQARTQPPAMNSIPQLVP